MFGDEELGSKKGVSLSQRLRMAEVVPKVVTGKEVGRSLERRGRSVQTVMKQEKDPRTAGGAEV